MSAMINPLESSAELDVNCSMTSEASAHYPDIDMPLDKGIEPYVLALRSGGIETFESCEGGDGHVFPETTAG